MSAVDYAAGQAAVYAFRRALQQWWADGWDLLLTPTVAEPPPPLTEFENDPSHPTAPMRRGGQFAAFTPPFNMSGQPAISLPLHRNAEGLPIGIQLAGAYGAEDVLIRVAAQLESAHALSCPIIRRFHSASRRKSPRCVRGLFASARALRPR